ncbi:NUDIX hydrolase domain-like protein, partial [Pseudomassariella vexata]
PSAPTTFTVAPSLSPFQVPLKDYLSSHPQFDGIASGALVFKPPTTSSPLQLLLVQRAAHDSMPLLWEIPGGACDHEDETLLHAVARELWEESGLKAKSIEEQVRGGDDELDGVFFTRKGSRLCKYSFLVAVEGFEVKLDANEHQRYVWVTEEEARAKRCGEVELVYTTKSQEAVVFKGFEVWRE